MPGPLLGMQRSNLENVAMLASLLERVERSAVAVDAGQYRSLVERLKAALGSDLPPGGLEAVLAAYPATSELYENLNYAHAGLCLRALEPAVAAETLARQALARLAGHSRA